MVSSKVSIHFNIADPSSVGGCRRDLAAIARTCDFNENEVGQLSIVVNELANNLLKHAKQGVLLARIIDQTGALGLELMTFDLGPGIANISEALRDGYSTAGSPGTGLGAIRRLSQVFDIYSAPGRGTVVLSQFWNQQLRETRARTIQPIEYGIVCLPNKGETVCGDNWATAVCNGRNIISMFDGLGHGILAAEAAQEAVQVVGYNLEREPGQIITCVHDSLKKTRGAAGALLSLDPEHRKIRFAGIGNISAAVIQPDFDIKRMASHNGTLGLTMTRVHEFDYAWTEGATLVMHSDGLASHWKPESFPGIYSKHPSILAALLFRDHKRGSDDVAILVAKERAAVACL